MLTSLLMKPLLLLSHATGDASGPSISLVDDSGLILLPCRYFSAALGGCDLRCEMEFEEEEDGFDREKRGDGGGEDSDDAAGSDGDGIEPDAAFAK